jgi:hypothetical protein
MWQAAGMIRGGKGLVHRPLHEEQRCQEVHALAVAHVGIIRRICAQHPPQLLLACYIVELLCAGERAVEILVDVCCSVRWKGLRQSSTHSSVKNERIGKHVWLL